MIKQFWFFQLVLTSVSDCTAITCLIEISLKIITEEEHKDKKYYHGGMIQGGEDACTKFGHQYVLSSFSTRRPLF